ncbi:MAG: glycosyltransferase family 2 protein [Dehalococcoidia bacterium]|jgi:glycosyltransferase involved in cell wall biosynthesis
MTQLDIKNLSVSVIIPSYNRAYVVSRAINSVLAQTYQNFEIVVVDDGSIDNTHQVVINFHDERVRYIRHEINMGVAAARNTGLRASVGEYIAFLDSDDEWRPAKLEKQIDAMTKATPDVGVVYTATEVAVGNQHQYLPLVTYPNNVAFKTVLAGKFPTTSTLLVRKECLLEIGLFDEEFRCGEDWDFMIRLSKRYGFKSVPEALTIYHRIADSITNRKSIIAGFKKILSKYFDDLRNNKAISCQVYIGLGHNLCMDGNMKEGRYYFMLALKTRPLNIKAALSLAIACSGPGLYKKISELYQNINAARV